MTWMSVVFLHNPTDRGPGLTILELPADHKGGPIFTLLGTDQDVPTYDNRSPSPPPTRKCKLQFYLPCQQDYIDIGKLIISSFRNIRPVAKAKGHTCRVLYCVQSLSGCNDRGHLPDSIDRARFTRSLNSVINHGALLRMTPYHSMQQWLTLLITQH